MKKIGIWFGAATVMIMAACKKDDSPVSTPIALIKKITQVENSDSTIFHITYNADSTVQKIEEQDHLGNIGLYKEFTHTQTLITSALGGGVTTDSIFLDALGRPIKSVKSFLPSVWYLRFYFYGSDGKLSRTVLGPGDTLVHAWSGGNMVSSTSTSVGDVFTYTHDLSKPSRAGDPMQVEGLLEFGRIYPSNTNLLQTLFNGEDLVTYSYEFDANGHITKVAGTDGSTSDATFYNY